MSRFFLIHFSCFFFFKQKTAYEMRISDWSSDVCSSDLPSDATLLALLDYRLAAYRDLRASSEADVLGDIGASLRAPFDVYFLQIGRASCRERVCQYV